MGTPAIAMRQDRASVPRTQAFQSILFRNAADRLPESGLKAPDHFSDLNLDQIIGAVTAGKEEYDLAPFFHMPLHDVDAVRYRHEVMRDLEDRVLFDDIRTFGRNMQKVRERLAGAEKRYDPRQKERWFLDAVDLYGETVVRLAHDLSARELRSRGLSAFKNYVDGYAESADFTLLREQAKRLLGELSAIRYGIIIDGLRVEVRPYQGEPDYSDEVLETFARFKQGAVKDYEFKFTDPDDTNHVESRILDLVVQEFADTFEKIKVFYSENKEFINGAIVSFDREIQFYIAYYEYIDRLKMAGLKFCYPRVSQTFKDVSGVQTFDLALATKLLSERAIPVTNDFSLTGRERILVVSGPNQGGKTTFARIFGQVHYLASLGCQVPGAEARLYLPDRIFTHFEREERVTTLRGKLEDDLVRMRAILTAATPRSIVVINEIFSSTALRDAVFLSKEIAATLIDLDVLGVWVTFIDEVASLDARIVSMVSTVVPDNPALRTFKIERRPADGLAYAMSIAEKYRLTYAMIKERICS